MGREHCRCNTSWCHPSSAGHSRSALCPSGAGRGPRPSPGPLRRRLSRPPCCRCSQQLSRSDWTHGRVAFPASRFPNGIAQQLLVWKARSGPSSPVCLSSRFAPSLSSGVDGTHPASLRRWEKGASQTLRGAFLGLTMSRQSRSPRARSWISISALPALVAMGTLCWSHSLTI